MTGPRSPRTHAGRRALVTGAGQGVGRAIVRSLAAAGAEVWVNDLDGARADSVVAEVRAGGGAASAAVFDVTDWPAVRRWVETAVGAAVPVDILVNNAGNAGRTSSLTRADFGLFADSDPAEWEPFLRVNLYGVLNVTRAVLPGMVAAGWGRVVTVVSDAGRVGEPTMAAYSAAKAGAAGFMRAVAKEVGRVGVTANCVSLGTVDTADEPAELTPDQARHRGMSRYPVPRPGRPEDVAPLVRLLTGPESAWITGQTYPVNGGYSSSL